MDMKDKEGDQKVMTRRQLIKDLAAIGGATAVSGGAAGMFFERKANEMESKILGLDEVKKRLFVGERPIIEVGNVKVWIGNGGLEALPDGFVKRINFSSEFDAGVNFGDYPNHISLVASGGERIDFQVNSGTGYKISNKTDEAVTNFGKGGEESSLAIIDLGNGNYGFLQAISGSGKNGATGCGLNFGGYSKSGKFTAPAGVVTPGIGNFALEESQLRDGSSGVNYRIIDGMIGFDR